MPTNNAPSAPNYSNSPVVVPKAGVSAAASSAALQNSRNATRGFRADDQQARIDQIARQNDEAIANIPFAISSAIRSYVASFFAGPKAERDRRAGNNTKATTKTSTPTSASTQATSPALITQESTKTSVAPSQAPTADTTTSQAPVEPSTATATKSSAAPSQASTAVTTTSQVPVEPSTDAATKSSTTTAVAETLFDKAKTLLSEAQASLRKIESYPVGTLTSLNIDSAKRKFAAQQAYLNSFVDNNNALDAESDKYKDFKDDISFIKILDIKAVAKIDLTQAEKQQEIVKVLKDRGYIVDATLGHVQGNYTAMKSDYQKVYSVGYNDVDFATKALAPVVQAADNIEETTENAIASCKSQCAAKFSAAEANMMVINNIREIYIDPPYAVLIDYGNSTEIWESLSAINLAIVNKNYIEEGSEILEADLEEFEAADLNRINTAKQNVFGAFTSKCRADFKAITANVARAKVLTERYDLSANIASVLMEYQELKDAYSAFNGGDQYKAEYDDLKKFNDIAKNTIFANVADAPTLPFKEEVAKINATFAHIKESQFVDPDLKTELMEADNSFKKLEKIQINIVDGAEYARAELDDSKTAIAQDLQTFDEAAANITTAGVKSGSYAALKIAQDRIAELKKPQYENFIAARDLDSMDALYNESSKTYNNTIKVANAADIGSEGNLSKIKEFLDDIYAIDIGYIRAWSEKALNDAYQYLQTASSDTSLTEADRRSLNDTYNLASEFYVNNISDLDLEGYKSGEMEERWSEFRDNVSRVAPATTTTTEETTTATTTEDIATTDTTIATDDEAATIEKDSSASGGGNEAGIIGGAVAGAVVVAALAIACVCYLRSKHRGSAATPTPAPTTNGNGNAAPLQQFSNYAIPAQ